MSAPTLDTLVELSGGRLERSDFPTDLDLASATVTITPGGTVILSDTAGATPDSMAAALKALVQLGGPDGRSFAVLGELDVDAVDSRDEHDRIGRLVVRLNVHQLVVVGQAARHIHNAAGLEGSWDGESELVDSPDGAYDLLREVVGSGDVVLIKSSHRSGLDDLAGRLAGDLA